MSASAQTDVLIVGAGPAGAASAGFLAREGISVRVLEREAFPRFHIGESLLPAGYEVLEDLGVSCDDPGVFVFKRGARFVCEATERFAEIDFSYALDGPPRHAWHVERAVFDQLLCTHAQAHGAHIDHGVTVTNFAIDKDGVTVETDDGERLRARYLIDASGQHRLVARKKRSVEPFLDFGKAAVFAHFNGVQQHAWDVLAPHHDIWIMMVPDGWIWVIPLPGQRLSIGLISRKKGIRKEWLSEAIAASPRLREWTRGASQSDVQLVANFSYQNNAAYGSRYACVGDAACFLDPVFSSGVTLGLVSAQAVSRRLVTALRVETEHDPELLTAYRAQQQRAYDTFASLIFRFYHTKIVDNLIFRAPHDAELRPQVTSVLTGDVFRDDNPFQEMLLSSRMRPRAGHSLLRSRAGR